LSVSSTVVVLLLSSVSILHDTAGSGAVPSFIPPVLLDGENLRSPLFVYTGSVVRVYILC
jgi:hypothetical protein